MAFSDESLSSGVQTAATFSVLAVSTLSFVGLGVVGAIEYYHVAQDMQARLQNEISQRQRLRAVEHNTAVLQQQRRQAYEANKRPPMGAFGSETRLTLAALESHTKAVGEEDLYIHEDVLDPNLEVPDEVQGDMAIHHYQMRRLTELIEQIVKEIVVVKAKGKVIERNMTENSHTKVILAIELNNMEKVVTAMQLDLSFLLQFFLERNGIVRSHDIVSAMAEAPSAKILERKGTVHDLGRVNTNIEQLKGRVMDEAAVESDLARIGNFLSDVRHLRHIGDIEVENSDDLLSLFKRFFRARYTELKLEAGGAVSGQEMEELLDLAVQKGIAMYNFDKFIKTKLFH